jgi:phage terminase large subunit GpA-like protein
MRKGIWKRIPASAFKKYEINCDHCNEIITEGWAYYLEDTWQSIRLFDACEDCRLAIKEAEVEE